MVCRGSPPSSQRKKVPFKIHNKSTDYMFHYRAIGPFWVCAKIDENRKYDHI